jgi:hypothetical protein
VQSQEHKLQLEDTVDVPANIALAAQHAQAKQEAAKTHADKLAREVAKRAIEAATVAKGAAKTSQRR